MTEIQELLEQVLAETEPNRDIDWGIHRLVYGQWLDANGYVRTGGGYHSDHPPIEGAWDVAGAEYYTSALDAITGLIEMKLPEWKWGIHQPSDKYRGYVVKRSALRPMPCTEDAATPALALCAAFLAAKASPLPEHQV